MDFYIQTVVNIKLISEQFRASTIEILFILSLPASPAFMYPHIPSVSLCVSSCFSHVLQQTVFCLTSVWVCPFAFHTRLKHRYLDPEYQYILQNVKANLMRDWYLFTPGILVTQKDLSIIEGHSVDTPPMKDVPSLLPLA